MSRSEVESKVVSAVIPDTEKSGHNFLLSDLAEMTGYHPVYLRRLMINGKIKGIKVKLGSLPEVWASTVEAVKEYETTRDRRGRPKGGKK